MLCRPQGSPLRPRLFVLHTTDLADATEKNGVTLHAFADDTQLPALRLLNAAARLLSDTKKFYRGLSQVMHIDLH